MEAEILAHVIRGDTVESVHRGHFVVIDADGRTIASAGDPSTVTFFRSACKSIQAIPFIASGAAEQFGFTDDEIALAVASHSGEQIHVETAARMLAKIGLRESDLHCGTHLPFNEAEAHRMIAAGEMPSQLHNNCSGKHVAMLALGKHLGVPLNDYESSANPVQSAILDEIANFAEIPVDRIATAIDGCSAPNFAVPICAMAKSFINLLRAPALFDDKKRTACERVVSAMIRFPELIGGTGRLDTILMRAAPGRLISKVGADGVWLGGVLPSDQWPSGLAIALKIEDGDDTLSRPVVAVELLRQFGILEDIALPELSPLPVRSRRGDQVGRIVPVFSVCDTPQSSPPSEIAV